MRLYELEPDVISFELLFRAVKGKKRSLWVLKEARSSWLEAERARKRGLESRRRLFSAGFREPQATK